MKTINSVYNIIELPDYMFDNFIHKEFDTAHEVSVFLWGRNLGKYAVYKNGYLADLVHLYPDVNSLEQYLRKMETP